jgi:hypothetical protein
MLGPITQKDVLMRKIVVLGLTLAALVACEKQSAQNSAGSAPTVQTAAPPLHNNQQCPRIKGVFAEKSDQKNIRSISTEMSGSSLILNDNQDRFIIDGQPHNNVAGSTYLGACQHKEIALFMFKGSRPIGQVLYSTNGGEHVNIFVKFEGANSYLEFDKHPEI